MNVMPELHKEVQLLAVEPGRTVNMEVRINRDAPRGVALWTHHDGSLWAFWTNVPVPNDKHGADYCGGPVSALSENAHGTLSWTNQESTVAMLLMNAFQGEAENLTRMRLLHANEAERSYLYGAGEDDNYNAIYVWVTYQTAAPASRNGKSRPAKARAEKQRAPTPKRRQVRNK